MKHLLLGLALGAMTPLCAMEPEDRMAQLPSKNVLIERLMDSSIDRAPKEKILAKLMENRRLSEEDMHLLEAYNLLNVAKPHNVPHGDTIAFGKLFSRFFNIQLVAKGMAGCLLSPTGINNEPDKLEVVLSILHALQMKDLEVTIKGHKGTLDQFINQNAFNRALDAIIETRTTGTPITRDNLGDYHSGFKLSLKTAEFRKHLTPEEYGRLIIDNRINIGYLFLLFGFLEEGFQDTDYLTDLFDKLLLNEEIENHVILNCINFKAILKGFGYNDRELPDIDGLRALISQALSWLSEDNGQAFNDLLAREGEHWRRTTRNQRRPHNNRW